MSSTCDCVHYSHTLLVERAWNTSQTTGTHCILLNATAGQEEGGDFIQLIQVETMGEKNQCKPLKWVYKAVRFMSEHLISQESTKSAAAGLWPDHTLKHPSLSASYIAIDYYHQIRENPSDLPLKQGLEQQLMENTECMMQMRQVLLVSTEKSG